jgi:hypothetical protein
MIIHSARALGFLRRRVTVIAAAVVVLLPAAAAFAQPTYNAGQSYWHVTHNPGGPGGSTNQILNQALQSGTPTNTYSHTELFQGSGSTKAKAGVGRTQSSTVAKVLFPSGLGVDQIDPSHTQSSSVVRIDFKGVWDINTTFGPSITGVFTVPFGATVGSGGSALFECSVSWDKIVNGVGPTAARTSYTASQSFGPGTYLTSFTAPSAPFGPLTFTPTAGVDQIIVRGWVQFAVNNDDEPTYSSMPEFGTGPGQFQPRPGHEEEDSRIFQIEPLAGFELTAAPEPGALSLLAGASLFLLRTRRRSAAR